MRRTLFCLILCFAPLNSARAALVLQFGDLYTGDKPAGASPWLTATFTQVSDGDVKLTLQANLTDPDEFITGVGFNFTGNSSQLTATPIDYFTIGTPSGLGNTVGAFDFGFNFPTSGGPERFQGTESYSVILSYSGDITPGSFLTTTENNPGYYAGAHVQGIGNNKSGKIGTTDFTFTPNDLVATPEPSTLISGGIFTLAGIVHGWRQRRKKAVA